MAAIPVQVQVPAGAPGGGRHPPFCNAAVPTQERAPSSGPATESVEDCSPEGSRRHLMDDTNEPGGPSTPHHVWPSEFCWSWTLRTLLFTFFKCPARLLSEDPFTSVLHTWCTFTGGSHFLLPPLADEAALSKPQMNFISRFNLRSTQINYLTITFLQLKLVGDLKSGKINKRNVFLSCFLYIKHE